MTFAGIVSLVLVAAIVLALLFVFFHIFIALIPVAAVAILLIWLYYRFFAKKDKNLSSTKTQTEYDWFRSYSNQTPPRKKAKNVTTKDIDDKNK
ncbi:MULTISPECIES: hypothetical protein [Lactobacillus]|uniref:Uncharacterized protein n=1 Tax=Lactobacillus xujianguonis TaxID=2495899 RepID=A0A437STM4_9LACO|nr:MULTISPECIES: hypothetical protein [Lactobacillus]RVU70280.1 hypothetical protein EJK17_08530 [Lactobacillus xujianguonis]RVU73318.1 hypothetical protein EJK20_08930 [Lactobacillus xujianguonis]